VREVVEVPVRYDGLDLSDVAELLNMTTDELVRRHSDQQWTVEFAARGGLRVGAGKSISQGDTARRNPGPRGIPTRDPVRPISSGPGQYRLG
jgi:hypothetical protein